MINDLTVVLLSCNRLETLKQALLSLNDQTLQNFDLLISDNGSDAKVLDYIKSVDWVKGNLQVISHPKNIGYTGNLQNAILNVKSKYISFLSDDNLLEDNCLEDLLLPFRNQLSNISISFSNHSLIDQSGTENIDESKANNLHWGRDFKSSTLVPQAKLLYLQIFKQVIAIDACICITKQMQESINLEKYALDHTLFAYYIMQGGDGFFVAKNLMKYRSNPQGMSQSKSKSVTFAKYKVNAYLNILEFKLFGEYKSEKSVIQYHLFMSYYTLFKYNQIRFIKLARALPKIQYLDFLIVSKIAFLFFTRKFLYKESLYFDREL
jgi:glycosyltransferase involved in cell wall biosynthesis